jgi:hypothetical protein
MNIPLGLARRRLTESPPKPCYRTKEFVTMTYELRKAKLKAIQRDSWLNNTLLRFIEVKLNFDRKWQPTTLLLPSLCLLLWSIQGS